MNAVLLLDHQPELGRPVGRLAHAVSGTPTEFVHAAAARECLVLLMARVPAPYRMPALYREQLPGVAGIGVWLGGALYEHTGSYLLVWWTACVLSALSAAVHLRIDDRRASRSQPGGVSAVVTGRRAGGAGGGRVLRARRS